MVKRTLLVLLCSLVSLGMMASLAGATDEGPYVSVQAGATWLENAEVDWDAIPSSTLSAEAEFDTGFNGGIAAGYDFGTARLEAEIGYRQNEVDSLKLKGQLVLDAVGVPEVSADGDGDVSAISFMVNGFWDIDTGSPVTPYLGAGIGVADVSVNDFEDDDSDEWFDDGETVFAYQFAAGVGFELTPRIILDVGYRYFATDDIEIETETLGIDAETEYETHSANLGVRFMF